MKKITLIIAVIVIVLAGAWFLYRSVSVPVDVSVELTTEEATALEELSTTDTTADIENDLGAVDVGNIDDLFQEIDSDLNQL